jgi:hypothetical protein
MGAAVEAVSRAKVVLSNGSELEPDAAIVTVSYETTWLPSASSTAPAGL